LFRTLLSVSLIAMLVACNASSTGNSSTATTTATSTTTSSTTNTGNTGSTGSTGNTVTGTISLQWSAPATRADGTPLSLSEISGYKVYYGNTPGYYPNSVDITDGSLQSATLTGVPIGSYYVAMTTVDMSGLESAYSAAILKKAL